MTDNLFVVCTRRTIERAVKTMPATLKAGEFLFQLEIFVPDGVFVKPPVPVVKIRMGERDLTTAEVRVDGQEQPQPVGARAAQQFAVQQALTGLLFASRYSTDPAVMEARKAVISDLMASGVDVQVVSQDDAIAGQEGGEGVQ